MPTPTFPSLGASTLVRKWIVEVNTGTVAAPIWKMLGGVNANQFNPDTASFEDDSDMQSGGAGSQTKTAGNSGVTMTVLRKVKADGISYDDAQEFIKGKSINKYGPANSVTLRISEYDPSGGPRVDAYMGNFGAGWEYVGGGNTSLDAVTMTFVGQGACAVVAHPYSTTAVVPTVTSVDRSLATAGGTVARIFGTSFTGTTAITVAGNAVGAGGWVVDNDAQITFTAPAHASGTGLPVIVTNATGASAAANVATYA